jgi:hypothetical protein
MLEINKLTRTLIVSPGSKHIETKIIPTSKIYVPKSAKGKTLNRARKKYLNQDHINKLAVALKEIDYSKRPPIVTKKHQWVEGVFYEYELVAGAHRFSAFEKMGISEWIFDVYELGTQGVKSDLAMSTLQIRENDHQPELASTADDLTNIMSYLISKNLIGNTEQSISDYLAENTSNLNGNTFKKVVLSTVRKNGAYQDIRTFPSSDIPAFMEKNIKQGEKYPYVCGGSHDVKRDKFGWSVLEGYEYEYLTNALKRLDETDKASYFILHTKAPTEKRGLDTRRKDMKKSFEQLERGIEKAYKYKKKHGEWPWNIEAFLGQDVKNKESNFLTTI